MAEIIANNSERFISSSEDELVDVFREHIKYIRNSGFYDSLNKDGKLTIIAMVLIANFLIMLISALGGLV